MRGSWFFEGVRQLDIELGGEPGKTPTFYYDGRAINALFPARLSRLHALMPDPRLVPARLAPGVGMVAITALEYADTDIRPYNELSIAVLLNEPSVRPNFPGRALWDSIARPSQAHIYVLHLPVTTNVALRGGVDFYNFPKFLAGIDFDATPNAVTCRLSEGDEPILTLSASPIAAQRDEHVDYFCHLFMDGQPQCAQFKQHRISTGRCRRPGGATLTLGTRHPIARELDALLLSRRSAFHEMATRMEAILFGPEHLTLPLVARGLGAAEAMREPAASGAEHGRPVRAR